MSYNYFTPFTDGPSEVANAALFNGRLGQLDAALTMLAAGQTLGEGSATDVVAVREHAVYALGDSITYAVAYTNKLDALLGAGWVVRNCGIGGNTTTQMAARVDAQVLNAGDAETVIVLGGINDIVNDVSAATIESNLQAIYTAAHNAGVRVIAVTVLPFKASALWSAGRQTVLDAVNTWILNTATNVDVRVDAYTVFESPADTLNATYDNGDGLHPNTTGSELLATTVYNATTWTKAAANALLAVATTGTIGLNQSLLSSDDVSFHNVSLSGTLDMPTWKPLVDSTAALKVATAAGAAIMTFDSTNSAIGIGTDPLTDTGLLLSRSSTGAGNVYGGQWRALKIDASGTTAVQGLKAMSYNYAIGASSTVTSASGFSVGATVYAGAGKTGTVTTNVGVSIEAPTFSGDGTKAITTNYGLLIANQGAAGVGTCYGLYIADQEGGSDNYALRSWSGKHLLGDADATIGFYGTAPTAQQVLPTGAGKTVDNVISALQALGLVKQA